jgi:hypothetical protein
MEHARRLCAAVVRWVKFYEERARVARKSGNVGIESTLETVISRVVFALSRQRLHACSSAGGCQGAILFSAIFIDPALPSVFPGIPPRTEWIGFTSSTILCLSTNSPGQSSRTRVSTIGGVSGEFEDSAWSPTKPVDRERLMQRLADLLERDADTLTELEAIDCGKSTKVLSAMSLRVKIRADGLL